LIFIKEMINTAVILTGGKSSRYGRPKGLETVDGQTLVKKIANEIRAAGILNIYLSTNEPEKYADLGFPTIPDKFLDCGPLAGIHSALVETKADKILVLPCDLPAITSSEIKKILEAAIDDPKPVVFAVTESRDHPLCSIVSSELNESIESALVRGLHSAYKFFRSVDHGTVFFEDESPFYNVNTQEDLKEWDVKKALTRQPCE